MVKIGGSALSDPAWLDRLGAAVQAAGPVVIVHGGGRAISETQERLGIPVVKRDGIRISTAAVAAVAEEVLCGPVRGAILQALDRHGVKAIGCSGVDGILDVELVDPQRLGRVGRVVGVDVQRLGGLLARGITPVLAPASRGADTAPVNVNADDVASAVCRALEAEELLLVSDVPGVVREGRVLANLRVAEVNGLIEEAVVTGGMVAKIRAAVAAGCARVRIGDLAMLTAPDAGTAVLRADSRAAA